ncbi:three-Cys-motif partner protein TcmP [Saccharicrinis sp. FJH2]|uniref:three-Cys-motif partner protein TcmP n=1 Tax=Saccharicrinis sp. FJH65 TaxID=3344659 RepID=UPI0035F3A1F0
MRPKDVKKNLLSHSEAKVNLLSEYLNRYLNIICNDKYTSQINIYDLFCGEGIYENGGEGSPIVIMKAVKNVFYKNVARIDIKTKINCNFNDLNAAKVAKTEKSIYQRKLYYPEFGTIKFTSEDYKEYLIELTKKLNSLNAKSQEKYFVFIDPYEYKHIKISHIVELISNQKTEVLLWLPTQFMYRFEKNGTPTALKDFIEELRPFEHWNTSKNVWNFINELKDSFQKIIGDNFFVDNFTIQKDNNTVFCLFFFTSHIKGFEKMLESKWKIDSEQGKGWHYTINEPSLFEDEKTNPLAEKLELYLKQKERTNGDIYVFTVRNGFLPKHTTEVLTYLQKYDKIAVFLQDGKIARMRSFYISYRNYKNEYSKVTIKPK